MRPRRSRWLDRRPLRARPVGRGRRRRSEKKVRGSVAARERSLHPRRKGWKKPHIPTPLPNGTVLCKGPAAALGLRLGPATKNVLQAFKRYVKRIMGTQFAIFPRPTTWRARGALTHRPFPSAGSLLYGDRALAADPNTKCAEFKASAQAPTAVKFCRSQTPYIVYRTLLNPFCLIDSAYWTPTHTPSGPPRAPSCAAAPSRFRTAPSRDTRTRSHP